LKNAALSFETGTVSLLSSLREQNVFPFSLDKKKFFHTRRNYFVFVFILFYSSVLAKKKLSLWKLLCSDW